MTTDSASTTNSSNTITTGTNGLAVTALVTGILSLVFCWGGWLFVATAAAAIFTGVKANRGVKGSRGAATAGIVLGIVAACFEFIFLCSIGRP